MTYVDFLKMGQNGELLKDLVRHLLVREGVYTPGGHVCLPSCHTKRQGYCGPNGPYG